jgi:predicted metal-dependent phosphoesterase TrpH
MLALTDHDDLDGLPSAQAAADELAMALVNGVEISIEWEALQIHILGFAFDSRRPSERRSGHHSLGPYRAGAAHVGELEKVGIGGAFEGAMRHAANPKPDQSFAFRTLSRGSGACKDLRSVFESYLVPGRPGYVDHRWATLADSVRWILGAGGVAAVAHPGRYKLSRADMRRFLTEFKDLGGQAIEVMSGSHTPEHVDAFARLAREYGFLASRGSDFHGPGESYVDLGKLAPLPDGLQPVWQLF